MKNFFLPLMTILSCALASSTASAEVTLIDNDSCYKVVTKELCDYRMKKGCHALKAPDRLLSRYGRELYVHEPHFGNGSLTFKLAPLGKLRDLFDRQTIVQVPRSSHSDQWQETFSIDYTSPDFNNFINRMNRDQIDYNWQLKEICLNKKNFSVESIKWEN